MKEFLVDSLSEYKEFLTDLNLSSYKFFVLQGELGSGKTTLTKEILKSLFDLKEEDLKHLHFMSPTYSILNEYQIKNKTILHFDFYRFSQEDFVDEFLEQIESADYIFVEWIEKVKGQIDVVSSRSLEIFIEKDKEGQRRLRLQNLS